MSIEACAQRHHCRLRSWPECHLQVQINQAARLPQCSSDKMPRTGQVFHLDFQSDLAAQSRVAGKCAALSCQSDDGPCILYRCRPRAESLHFQSTYSSACLRLGRPGMEIAAASTEGGYRPSSKGAAGLMGSEDVNPDGLLSAACSEDVASECSEPALAAWSFALAEAKRDAVCSMSLSDCFWWSGSITALSAHKKQSPDG